MSISEKQTFKHHIPRNSKELKKVNEILKAQNEFDKKIEELHTKLDGLFQKYIDYKKINTDALVYLGWLEGKIHHQIVNIFAKELMNSEWTYANLTDWHYPHFVHGRKLGCEICGDNRTVDRCHIVPNRLGAGLGLDNIFILCPTHHRLLDSYLLTKEEFAQLNISDKSPEAKKYFTEVIEPNMVSFWNAQKKPDKRNEEAFYKKIRLSLLKYLKEKKEVEEHDLIKNFPMYHKEIMRILNHMITRNVVVKTKSHSYMFYEDKEYLLYRSPGI